jgi:hypothetical protein
VIVPVVPRARQTEARLRHRPTTLFSFMQEVFPRARFFPSLRGIVRLRPAPRCGFSPMQRCAPRHTRCTTAAFVMEEPVPILEFFGVVVVLAVTIGLVGDF